MSKPEELPVGRGVALDGDGTRFHADSDNRQLVKIGFFDARSDMLIGTVEVGRETLAGLEEWTQVMVRGWLQSGRPPSEFRVEYDGASNGYRYSVRIDDEGKHVLRFPGPSVETDPGLPAVPTFMHRRRPTPNH